VECKYICYFVDIALEETYWKSPKRAFFWLRKFTKLKIFTYIKWQKFIDIYIKKDYISLII